VRAGKLAYVDERLADVTTWTALNAGVGTTLTCHDISGFTTLHIHSININTSVCS